MSLKQSAERAELRQAKRLVIKIGSALLTANGAGLDHRSIASWVKQVVQLHQQGIDIILVSSGAVAEGMVRLGWSQRPVGVSELQAAAAVGQVGLVQTYQTCFQEHQLQTAQLLLTHDDLSNRRRYLNSRNTLNTLLSLQVIPIINENDTVATQEIRFGDNDTLAGLVANLAEADALIILTDQDGLYDADPRSNPQAQLIHTADINDASLDTMAGDSAGSLGRGGRATKLKAARLAARSGTCTIIAGGAIPNVLNAIIDGEDIGTLLTVTTEPLTAKKQWLSALKVKGYLYLDEGAAKVLSNKGSSLLPVGVMAVEGEFTKGELVCCLNTDGIEIARGLANYNAKDARLLVGHSSDKIADILGYKGDSELIHRDNLVVM